MIYQLLLDKRYNVSVLTLIIRPLFFFFNDTATTEIYTLSLHDALPISIREWSPYRDVNPPHLAGYFRATHGRSEEHTSELQSRLHLVCRLLLEKKKNPTYTTATNAAAPRPAHYTRCTRQTST